MATNPSVGRTDRLGAFHASLAAMAWATRDDTIETEFWDEVFDALVLGAEAEMGMAQAVISGLPPKSLLKILKVVFLGLDDRFGRKFVARRPFHRLATQRPHCLVDQLAWLAEQADAAVIATPRQRPYQWILLKDVEERQLIVGEPGGATRPASLRLAITAINAKSIIVVERRRDCGD